MSPSSNMKLRKPDRGSGRVQSRPYIFGIMYRHIFQQIYSAYMSSNETLKTVTGLSHRSLQLSGPGPFRIRGEAPSSLRSDLQLQRGELRFPGVQRVLRPMLLALFPHLPHPRTQHGADPADRSPVSLPRNQRGGPECGGS